MSRKIIHLLFALLLVFSACGPLSVHAWGMTAEEKFKALVDAGIFEGYEDGSSVMDGAATRADAAKVVALLLGLEPDFEGAMHYTDLEAAEWAIGFIGAATSAGIMQGRGDGSFDPHGQITLQELAIVYVEALGLEIDPDAEVEGADDWAAAYVAAAIAAGLIPESSDYTVPATKDQLTEATFGVYEELVLTPGLQSANQSGVRRVSIRFGDAIDPDAKITIERIGDDGG